MNRNIKYKTVCRLVLNGGDDLNKNLNSSQYSHSNNNITNSKRMSIFYKIFPILFFPILQRKIANKYMDESRRIKYFTITI